jgi:hypothetical protein
MDFQAYARQCGFRCEKGISVNDGLRDHLKMLRIQSNVRWIPDLVVWKDGDSDTARFVDVKSTKRGAETGNVAVEKSAIDSYLAFETFSTIPVRLVWPQFKKWTTPRKLSELPVHERYDTQGSNTPYVLMPIDELLDLADLFERRLQGAA